jgi:hypothetical protein
LIVAALSDMTLIGQVHKVVSASCRFGDGIGLEAVTALDR